MSKKEQLITNWRTQFYFPERLINAFNKLNREDFIPPDLRAQAYDDTPLPIPRGKTISQPTTVMIMTHALNVQEGEKIFEVGAGSGFQTALLATLVSEKGKIITTEVKPELVTFAKENLARAGLYNVRVIEADGSQGLDNEAPFDKIIITAACKELPPKLVQQLKIGGIIVAPVGTEQEQTMIQATKMDNGDLHYELLGPFVFSPLYGPYGFKV